MTAVDENAVETGAPAWLTVPDDANALDPVLWPTSARRDADGQMLIGGSRVQSLIERFGSPVHIIDEDEFRSRARAFATSFAGWTVYYAGKAFVNRTIARWVDEEGLSLDVCSGNELAVALSTGFPPERIAMHGNNKSIAELSAAIEAGVGRIVVDCVEEIDRVDDLAGRYGREAAVLVRVTTGVEAHTHDYIATAHEDQKFGFSLQSGQALDALLACHAAPHIRLLGVHSHIGSQIFDTEGFAVAARRALGLIHEFRARTGTQLEEVNLGGGFGIAYTAQDAPLSPSDLHRGLSQIVEQVRTDLDLGPLRYAIEPGRAIVGPAGVALYTVGVVKPVIVDRGSVRTYVAVDGGMSDNVRTALYHADYTAILAGRPSHAEPKLARVVGKHCESGDILVRDVYLPADLRPGDILAVPGVGAYARALSSNYNHAARPAVIAVGSAGVRPILRRETLDDLLALDMGPTGPRTGQSDR